jgi:hypothetical protein
MNKHTKGRIGDNVGAYVRVRSKPSPFASKQKVLAPSLDGEDVEATVVFKRKAQYTKPSFA